MVYTILACYHDDDLDAVRSIAQKFIHTFSVMHYEIDWWCMEEDAPPEIQKILAKGGGVSIDNCEPDDPRASWFVQYAPLSNHVWIRDDCYRTMTELNIHNAEYILFQVPIPQKELLDEMVSTSNLEFRLLPDRRRSHKKRRDW